MPLNEIATLENALSAMPSYGPVSITLSQWLRNWMTSVTQCLLRFHTKVEFFFQYIIYLNYIRYTQLLLSKQNILGMSLPVCFLKSNIMSHVVVILQGKYEEKWQNFSSSFLSSLKYIKINLLFILILLKVMSRERILI